MAFYYIWDPATATGPSNADNEDSVTLGTRFTLSADGWVTHLLYWRGTLADDGVHTGAIYTVGSGTQVPGTLVTFADSGTGWQTAALDAPVHLDAATMYVVAIHHPGGGPAFTAGYFSSGPGASGITSGIITAPNTATAGGQGVFSSTEFIAEPTSTFGGNGYWSNVRISDTDPSGQLTADAADSIGILDAATKFLDYVRTPADLFGITDAAQATTDAARATADPVGLTDSATTALDVDQAAADNLGITDQATAQLDLGQTGADLVGITDTAITATAVDRTTSDAVGLTDTATSALGVVRSAAETVGITDNVTAVLTGPGSPNARLAVGAPHARWAAGPPRVG